MDISYLGYLPRNFSGRLLGRGRAADLGWTPAANSGSSSGAAIEDAVQKGALVVDVIHNGDRCLVPWVTYWAFPAPEGESQGQRRTK